ncbi:unnamed protein product (macronuclear) [Paramecium tetraurelia]|uniref:Uncharacterized protein n=1 Tax=Paramecium tetraurelia TaxID=5888 RepID=A0DES0_PARTE|nr:uncharacterized protein GSPATT00016363001 [Paramecium tetraurelia]CAK81537.1 unnamed protein product [Paramecium tetraurelia]|eukprot:XP_001448934.1 hypothetical protein (macronuclear) [Paramecium tetraurelia strain d4-2]
MEEEDCTIFIEELKSDDPNLKINAVTKIVSIAQILGPVRTCSELIPYLIDIIEEQDNEDEFLIKLAQELVNLKPHTGTNAHLLNVPLEILSSMEEPLVREKAVESLLLLAEDMPDSFFENHFFQIVQQLGQWDNFPSRISAASLFPLTYKHVSFEKKNILWELYKQLCGDDTPMVRRVCAGVLSDLAKIKCQPQQLLTIWETLLKDPVDSVKIKAIEGSQQMLKLIDDNNELDTHLQAYFSLADPREKSWRVRYTVPECLESIIEVVDKTILKTKAVPVFQQLLKDPEPEVRSITVMTIYNLLKEIPITLKDQFLPFFQALSTDTSQHVRMSLAEQICKISKQYTVQVVIQTFIPLISTLIKDDVSEIKIKLAHNLDQLSQTIGPENSKKHLVPLISSFATEKQWRFRLEMMSIIPKLLKVAGYDSFLELQEIYLDKGVLNHYQAIRDQAIDNLVPICENFGYDKIRDFILRCISKQFEQPNYIFRVSAMHSITKLRDVLSIDDLLNLFKDITSKSINDRVPNVRLNAFKLFSAIQDKLDYRTQNEFKDKSRFLQQDDDKDVQFYASTI